MPTDKKKITVNLEHPEKLELINEKLFGQKWTEFVNRSSLKEFAKMSIKKEKKRKERMKLIHN